MKNVLKTMLLAMVATVILAGFAPAQSANCGDTDYACKVGLYTGQIAANPKDFEAYYSRGRAYEELAEYDQAIADLTKYIASNPTNKEYLADGYNHRGNCYNGQKNWTKAIADYTTGLQLFPKMFVYVNRGNAYQEMNDLVKAIDDYNHAIAMDVKAAEAYYNRARAYYKQKLYSKAVGDLDIYITLNKTNKPFLADGYWNRSNANAALGNTAEAFKDINAAIDTSAKAGMYRSRAALYRKQGKIALATADEQMAEEMK